MFEGRKIKKLLNEYAEVDTGENGQRLVSDLAEFGEEAVQYTIESFRQRKLDPEKAQFLMEKLCDESCIEILVPLIRDPYGEVRRVAKEMIINKKEWRKSIVPLLIESLKSSDFYSRNNAAELLSMMKDQSIVPTLVSMFNSANPELKKNIIRVLSGIGGKTATKLIVSALNDESWEVRLHGVKCIGKMKAPESVDPLMEMLGEKDPQMRRHALDALGAIGDKKAALPMIVLLKDDDMLIRQKAMEYIIEMADAQVVPDVLKLMKDEDVNVRRCAVEVINNLKDPRTSDALMNAIRDSDWWVRQIATDSLTDIKGDKIVKAFIAMTQDPDESMRRCAVEFFNNVPVKASIKSLLGLLKDEDWWVREKAVTALGKLKDKRTVPFLAKMVDDQEVKSVVPSALAEIGGDEALDLLKEFFLDEAKLVKTEVIKAYGKLKVKDVVPDLKECLKDPDDDIREEALKALKELTGKTFKAAKGQKTGPVSQTPVSKVSATEGTILTEAILVLDLCNSTDIAARYGDNFAMNLMKQLTETVTSVAGRERFRFIKGTGDGFLITFPKVGNSVHFAIDVLKEIGEQNAKADETGKINLRFAINLGETRVKDDGDRLGLAVNMTFRVEGVQPEGLIPIENGMEKEDMPLENRVFLTENAVKEIGNVEGVKTKMVGLFELKGITGLHKVYQVTSAR